MRNTLSASSGVILAINSDPSLCKKCQAASGKTILFTQVANYNEKHRYWKKMFEMCQFAQLATGGEKIRAITRHNDTWIYRIDTIVNSKDVVKLLIALCASK